MHPEPDRNLARHRLARHRVLLGAGIVIGLVVSAIGIMPWLAQDDHGAEFAPPLPALLVPTETHDEQRPANALTPDPTQARPAAAPKSATNPPVIKPGAAPDITPDLPPLVQRIDDLARRADAGDVAASCMLGAELLQCAERKRIRSWLRLVELGPHRLPSADEGIPAARATLSRLEQHCAGVSPSQIADAPRRIFDAADGGNSAAASLAVLRGQDLIYARMAANPELVIRLRDGYPRWVDSSLQGRDVEAAEAIVRSAAFGSSNDLGLQALLRDRVAMRALDLALVRIAEETGEEYGELPALRLAQSETALDAESRARANVLSQRWFDVLAHFPNDDNDAIADAATTELRLDRLDVARASALHARCDRG
jgi:hypothetical protein